MSEAAPDYLPDIFEQYQDGQQIMWVEGTLTKLYPAKNTAHGQIQNGEITDADGNVGKITFADIIQPTTARNQFISVACTHGAHGYTGVKVKDDGEYGRYIWVTPSATITYPNGAPPPEPPKQGQRPPANNRAAAPQTPPRRPQAGPRQPAPPPARGGAPRQPQAPQGNNTNSARGQENQFDAVAKFTDCYFHVHSLVNERMGKMEEYKALDPHQLADLVSRSTATIFVDVAKSGTAANWNPKLKPRRFPLPPTDPTDWANCYIEKEGSALDGKKLSEIADDDLRKLHDYYDQKKSNTPLAECIYQAAIDRKLFKHEEKPAEDSGQEAPEEDDIPF